LTTQVERLTRMEVEVVALKESLDEHKRETKERFDEMSGKLDDLLALRNKGAGVFWLITTLVGTGIVGGAWQVLNFILGRN
jgi:hypothetical protein